MEKIYQPFILTSTEEIIQILEETNFFEEHELKTRDFARQHISDTLTQKFIKGEIDSQTIDVLDEDEFGQMLKEIIVGTVLNELKEKGFVNSYEDENISEVFFLTTEGKEYLKSMLNGDSV